MESKIAFENSVGYVIVARGGFEIRLNNGVYSISLGVAKTIEQAERFLGRLESNSALVAAMKA